MRPTRPLASFLLLVLVSTAAAHAAPGRPAGLQAQPKSDTEIRLIWEDTADNETGFVIQARVSGGSFATIGTVGANNQAAIVQNLAPGIKYDFRIAAAGASGQSAFSNVASAYTDEDTIPVIACAPNGGVCLDNRFRVTGTWRTSQGTGVAGPHPITNLSSAFYFFQPDNLEVLLKVLDGCGINNTYWVFFSATTNVEFTLEVTDTQKGVIRRYFNPIDHAAIPVQDTGAFATCP
jgi:hypothetical protein